MCERLKRDVDGVVRREEDAVERIGGEEKGEAGDMLLAVLSVERGRHWQVMAYLYLSEAKIV